MKNKSMVGLLGLILMTTIVVTGCAGSPSATCKIDSDCIDGYVCYPDGTCLAKLEITTTTINHAVADSDYSSQITATGGRGTYTWSLEIPTASADKLDWLEMDSTTGMLRNKSTDQPELSQASNDAGFTITVTDSTASVEGKTTSKPFTMVIDECAGTTSICFAPLGGICRKGDTNCNNGSLDETCYDKEDSDYISHCGPECTRCDSLFADRCFGGLCRCGMYNQCTGDFNCCNIVCKNINNGDTDNCGGCGLNCSGVLHADGVTCANGACSYSTCMTGYTDCNSNKTDGCETSNSDISQDSSCGCSKTNCFIQITNRKCIEGNGSYVCGCEGNGNCGGSSPDCCDNQCINVTSNDINNCGVCGSKCDYYWENNQTNDPECVTGSCKCSMKNDCDDSYNGHSCVEGICVCGSSQNIPCPKGMYCIYENPRNYCCLTNQYSASTCKEAALCTCAGNTKCCDSCSPDLGCV